MRNPHRSCAQSFTNSDTIGCYLDLDKREIYFSKNGQMFDRAFTIPKELANEQFYPAVVMKVDSRFAN